jgi:YD repeat-containing protein
MRLITKMHLLAGSLFSLCGCSKENTTPTPIAARETNVFGWPVSSETCKPATMAHQFAAGTETTVFTYNIYGLTGIIAKTNDMGTTTDNFAYDASNKLIKITDATGGNWRFIYNSNAGKRAGAIYHAYTFNGSGVTDTLLITYPEARTLVISVRHPFADSMYRDTLLLNSSYNPVNFKRTRQGNGNDSTSTFIMNVAYTYGSALNPLPAEAAIWNWLQPLYNDMRVHLANPLLYNQFTRYADGIIPIGGYLQQSYVKTDSGPRVFNGTYSNVVANSNNYPASFLYTATAVSDTFTFQYNCQ